MSSQPNPTPGGCHGCRHFAVTYDVEWPYACEIFGLRSKRLPSVEVREASGRECMAREGRQAQVARRPPQLPPGGGVWA
ncbi:hypothetical protein [Engelhardtia mirabilis]|uniref:Uracil-DNA glycosylase n=1 Tax=Engelhardtia mirabilis TaxID=2528011 RepID=A0A518BRY8_9BACT|nr:hypothetical protein Pla133_48550 [Planctomycetes bacterium Pla133]QDV04059.1 hypothetical protein Pla86_48530 [Planctomycetes bacterium Pla86]